MSGIDSPREIGTCCYLGIGAMLRVPTILDSLWVPRRVSVTHSFGGELRANVIDTTVRLDDDSSELTPTQLGAPHLGLSFGS